MLIRRRVLASLYAILAWSAGASARPAALSAQEFQPMRLAAGSYEIGGAVATLIDATCQALDAAIPATEDLFRGVSGDAYVTRIAGNTRETRPLRDAIGPWLRVHGTGTTERVQFEPVAPDPSTRFVLEVRSTSVLGESQTVASKAARDIAPTTLALHSADKFEHQLAALSGADGWLARDFRRAKQRAEWLAQSEGEPTAAASDVRDFVSSYRHHLRDLRLTTVRNGRLLSPTQLTSLKTLLGAPFTTHYNADFRQAMQEYTSAVDLLGASFDADLTSRFVRSVSKSYEQEEDLTDALETAKAELLPEAMPRLSGLSGARDIAAMYLRHPIGPDQQDALRHLTKIDVSKSDDRLASAVLISTDGHEMSITSSSGQHLLTTAEHLTPQVLQRVRPNDGPVLIDGDMSRPVARALDQNGVTFAMDFNFLLAHPHARRIRPHVILVGSPDAAVAQQLYGTGNTTSLTEAIETVRGIGGDVVDNREALDKVLEKLAADEAPILIFHSTDDGIAFDVPMSNDEIAARCADGVAITCSLFDLTHHGYGTTADIELAAMVRALKTAQSHLTDGHSDLMVYLQDVGGRYREERSAGGGGGDGHIVVGSLIAASALGFAAYEIGAAQDTDSSRVARRGRTIREPLDAALRSSARRPQPQRTPPDSVHQ